jgi:hypothetical protein
MAVLGLLLSAGGCSGVSQSHSQFQADDQGTVEFEEVVDWSFKASHPITINRDTIARILHGVRVGTGQGSQAFTDQEVEFLSPSISAALAKASPEQVVVFRVISGTNSAPEATGGTIYVQGQSVYLTLTQFRSKPIKTGFWSWAASKPTPPQELMAGTLTFRPESTARMQRAAPDVAMNYANLSTLVVDYLVLARLTDHELMPAAAKPQTITTNAADSSSQPPVQIHTGATVLVPAQPPVQGQEHSTQAPQDRPSFIPAVQTPPIVSSPGTAKTLAGTQPAAEAQSKPKKPVKSKKSSKPVPKATMKKAPQTEAR